MNFYSPFTDSKFNFLPLAKVNKRHLVQLNDCDEGYKLEFKENLDKSVKKKIPKIITSFANSDGGWLIIGIDDINKELKPIPKVRADYSQTISQLIKRKVSPLPKYDVKFIKTTKQEGILIIYVYEGNFPPYVADGTIYIRNASSTEPITAERSSIEYLYNKSRIFENELKDFCKRNIYFPSGKVTNEIEINDSPILNIYLKNISDKKDYSYDLKLLDDIKELVLDDKNFANYQHGNNSLIFMMSKNDPSDFRAVSPVWEISSNLSYKFHLPLTFGENKRVKAIEKLRLLNITKDLNLLTIFDGAITAETININMQNLMVILKKIGYDLSDYALCLEIENGANSVVYIESENYFKFIKKYGLFSHITLNIKSNIIFLKNSKLVNYNDLNLYIILNFLGNSFGYSRGEFAGFLHEYINKKYGIKEES